VLDLPMSALPLVDSKMWHLPKGLDVRGAMTAPSAEQGAHREDRSPSGAARQPDTISSRGRDAPLFRDRRKPATNVTIAQALRYMPIARASRSCRVYSSVARPEMDALPERRRWPRS